MDVKVCILHNDDLNSVVNWRAACDNAEIAYDEVNLCWSDAIDKLKHKNYDLFLTWPPGINENEKKIYDEKLLTLQYVRDELGVK
jgi:hypothetical protein